MALYFYQAFSKEGKRVTGYVDAATTQAVRDQLAKMNLLPTTITPAPSQTARLPFFQRIFQRGVSLKDKMFFTKQLSVLLKSGIALVQALDLLAEQTEGRLQSIVISLRDGIKEGRSLADELQRFPAVFDTIYIQLVKAGEASGKLEVILERLNDYLERTDEMRGRIKDAIRYPLIQLAVIVLITVLLLWKVVPQIVSTLESQKVPLPAPTRFLIALSTFFTHNILFIAVGLVIIIAGLYFWSRSASGSYTIDRLKLKLPLIKYFSKMGAIVQFSRTLGILIEGGVNLPEALGIVTKIVNNKVLTQQLEIARDNIIKQGKMAPYLKETGLFPPVAIYLINTGEQSGQLDAMLLTVARYYEDDLEERADSLSALLNPLMLLIMAGVIGFIILAVLGPLQNIGSVAQKATSR
ncbi:type II secretion system F family protein [Candidatus Dependentiae bacterium]|nr:type II secretion system F family protein [Candidatus Dependentiae bacterium]